LAKICLKFLVGARLEREREHDDPLVRHRPVLDSRPAPPDRGGASGHGLEPHGRQGRGPRWAILTKDIRAYQLEALTAALKPGDIAGVDAARRPACRHRQACLEKGAHFVSSSSYIAPEMRALDQAFREAGLVSINEVGLDPGIDHLMAHDLVARYRASRPITPTTC
jgi:hypothetical protein